MKKIFIEGRREGYSTGQCDYTMSVKELIEYLSQFEDDAKVYLNNDNGYTFGSITESSFSEEDEWLEEL